MKTVGIDPSLTSTGLAVIVDGRVVGTHTIKSKAPDVPSVYTTRARLHAIVTEACVWAAGADLVVVEQLPPGMSPKASASIQDRAGLMWLLLDALIARDYEVALVLPPSLKRYATGKGGGAGTDKLAVTREADKRFPGVEIVDDNAADALWLAHMGAHHLGEPVVRMPTDRASALDGVAWPALGIAA